MDTVTVTPNLTMRVVKGWQVYVWRCGDSVTLIDTGAPGSGAAIAEAVPGIRRLAALDVETACFGHGEPILSGARDRLRDVAATLTP